MWISGCKNWPVLLKKWRWVQCFNKQSKTQRAYNIPSSMSHYCLYGRNEAFSSLREIRIEFCPYRIIGRLFSQASLDVKVQHSISQLSFSLAIFDKSSILRARLMLFICEMCLFQYFHLALINMLTSITLHFFLIVLVGILSRNVVPWITSSILFSTCSLEVLFSLFLSWFRQYLYVLLYITPMVSGVYI